MIELWGKTYTRMELLRRVGDMSQLADVQPFELVNGNERGCRGVWLRNAAGLEVMVIAERGMGITSLVYKGVPLPFTSSVGISHPTYAENVGMGWLRNWPGGFLTPCGMTQVGEPCIDNGNELSLHGRLSNIPARNLAWGGEWQGEDYVIWVEGQMRETVALEENILLTRRIWTRLNEPRFWIEDIVENQSFSPTPLMYLQHINLGFPLVDKTTLLELPERVTQPRDEAARRGLEQCCQFDTPIPNYQEQVFYHELKSDTNGQVEVKLVNPAFDGGRGLSCYLRYFLVEYPWLVEWKMMGEGSYVIGLEPANCHVEGRSREREMGTLQMLEPHGVRSYHLEIGF